jgi:hypothetical protein
MTTLPQFGLCLNNRGYSASLEIGKLYRVVPDEDASRHGYIRVVDESAEDYGYSADRFFVLEIPRAVAHAPGTARTSGQIAPWQPITEDVPALEPSEAL